MALFAFAANSVLCRLALGSNSIDPGSFTFVRLLSGSLMLALIVQLQQSNKTSFAWTNYGSWSAALALFVYAAAFSFAYLSLDTATGALILFASVQISMILMHLWSGARLAWLSWVGFVIAFSGFVFLVAPDIASPNLFGVILMAMAGVAWGVYSIKGKQASNATITTAANFLMTLPMLPLLLLFTETIAFNATGLMLAIASGALASGVGYSIWYLAVAQLRAEVTAISQLSVPVLAALGGIVWVNEPIALRLIISGSVILLGICLVIVAPKVRT